MTQHFIVVGNPIAHSKSPEIHANFAKQVGLDICYQKQYCPNDEDSFVAVVEAFFAGGGVGANVTVPFKQMAYKLCGQRGGLSPHAQVAGAVNTLLIKDGQIYGDNTDGQGLVNHIQQLGWRLSGAKIAIIGAGGATRGAILPLIQAGVSELTLANRTLQKAQDLIQQLRQADTQIADTATHVCTIDALTGHFDIVINATSIGLSGETLPLANALTCEHAYDMMYGRKLPFLQHFADLGAVTSDGYGMLIGQAALSFEQWTGHCPKTTTLLHAS